MMAATLPDLDGISLAWGQDAYQRWHHVLGHNVFFGLLLSAGCSLLSRPVHRVRYFLVCLALFHLHLVMDFYGSGPGWEIHYLWPLTYLGWGSENAWEFGGWQNYVAMGALFVWSLVVAWWRCITPFELVAPSVDGDLRGIMTRLRGSR